MKSWRYQLALGFILAAMVCGLLCVINATTASTSIMEPAGLTHFHRTVWLGMAAGGCLLLALMLVGSEVSRRRDQRLEARSPIDRTTYINLLRGMINYADKHPAQPVRAEDVQYILTLIQPASTLAESSLKKGE